MRNLQGLQYQHLVSWNLIPQRLAKFKLEHIHCAFIIQQNVSRSSGGPFASSFSVNGGGGPFPRLSLAILFDMVLKRLLHLNFQLAPWADRVKFQLC